MDEGRRNFIKEAGRASLGLAGAALIPKVALSISQETKEKHHVAKESKNSGAASELLKGQYAQLKELQKKEGKVFKLFGEFYPKNLYRAKEYESTLEELKEEITSQLDSGKKPVVKNIFDEPLGSPGNSETPKTTVQALNTRDGPLSQEALEQILQETYPKGWVDKEVASIEQVAGDMPIVVNGKIKNALSNFVVDNDPGSRVEIYFYNPARYANGELVVRGLSSQLGSANNWSCDSEMTATERADLILEVYECMPESKVLDAREVDNPHKARYSKAKNYWGRMCMQYFADPTKLSDKERKLVSELIKKTDPTFDVMAAKAKRESLTPGFVAEKDKKDKRDKTVEGSGTASSKPGTKN